MPNYAAKLALRYKCLQFWIKKGTIIAHGLRNEIDRTRMATSVFDKTLHAKITAHLARFETRRSAILPILNDIHAAHGFVSSEQVLALETEFDLPRVQVQEVITFYSRYRQQRPARYHIQFCDNIVCRMFDSERVIGKLRQKAAGCAAGMLSIEPVPCLGVCDGAPAMLVNDERHLRVTCANVEKIVDGYLQGTSDA